MPGYHSGAKRPKEAAWVRLHLLGPGVLLEAMSDGKEERDERKAREEQEKREDREDRFNRGHQEEGEPERGGS